MFEAIRRWRERRTLASSAIPEALWREALEALPFLAVYTEPEFQRLRERVVLFLNDKSIVGAEGFEVTPLMRAMIAIQACVLVLNLDQRLYDGWENVIVYPDEFVTNLEYEDEAGVVHRRDEPLAGEAMPGGPVVLSWPDIVASADWSATGMNLVIHEFAHKIDMRNGEANGFPPLPPEMPRRALAEGDERRVCALPRAGRKGRGHGDRSVRFGESRRSSSPCSPKSSSPSRPCCGWNIRRSIGCLRSSTGRIRRVGASSCSKH